MPTLGFLHTADVHVPTFAALRAELAPTWSDRHIVDASLLAEARADGITEALTARLDTRLRELADADVILCTCSTLGALAEQRPIPALRVDRPMAEAAVRTGPRVAVVFTVQSTVEPTVALLHDVAARLRRPCVPIPAPCLTAWPAFESGSLSEYAERVADTVRDVAPTADAVVLAQASMAPAATLLSDLPIPVLTSPRTAVAAAVKVA